MGNNFNPNAANLNRKQQQQPNGEGAAPTVEQEHKISPLEKAMNYFGKNLRSVREWVGADGRTNATVQLKQPENLPAGFNSIGEIGERILENMRTIRDSTGNNTYAQFKLSYDRKTVQARLLAISEDGKSCTMALEIEHNISGASASNVTSFKPKGSTAQPVEQVEEEDLGGF